jgi:mRNA interferase MazF
MRRGEVWTVSATGYAGKPRPAVIVQDDRFDATSSVTLCVFTTNDMEAPIFRVPVEPNERNGLQQTSRLAVDRLVSVPRSKLGKRVGRLDDEDVARLNRAILVFLGLV